MRLTNVESANSRCAGFIRFAMLAVVVAGGLPVRTTAQQKSQKTFPSAEAASKALYSAVKSNSDTAILEVLGQDAKTIISSGDAVEDKERLTNFVVKFEQMHRLVREPDGTTTLYVGAMNWPMPIPLMEKASVWYFDTDEAKREILFRQIGRNEISAIGVCQELVKAQKEYQSERQEYAQHIFSRGEEHDGLYWKAAEGQRQSPIGPLVATAVSEGYSGKEGTATPYRGYYFHVLHSQGKDAAGGAKSYVVDGKMTDGFAFIAFPKRSTDRPA